MEESKIMRNLPAYASARKAPSKGVMVVTPAQLLTFLAAVVRSSWITFVR